MREAIASTYIYNIIFVFLAIVFAFVMGTIIYYKSMKVNKVIIASIEKYEGYNHLSSDEIDQNLKSIGYGVEADGKKCPTKSGSVSINVESGYKYCVYLFDNDTENGTNKYYSYGVTTYITLNFPFANIFIKVPVYAKSNRIFRFGA